MVIIGIDPGTIYTGYGIVSYQDNCFTHISNGLVKLSSIGELSLKLELIYKELNRIIKLYKPDEFAIETAFYGKNVQSAMKIGYARGVSILAAVHNNLPITEYSPREIKKSVVGNGAASKEQVSYMVKTLLTIKPLKLRFDESDALAVALCRALRLKMPGVKSRNWKAFIEEYPERIINQ